jgi:4-amino-4-deoxy-L-arabinose transferase-like glycosyltransferase
MKNNIPSVTIHKHTLAIFLVFIVGTFLRVYNLNWDMGQYLHPDERLYINAANLFFPHSIQEFLSPTSPLNPHMFYYGSFPLYLYKFVATFLIKSLDILLVSRMISAFFSSLTIVILYLATKEFFSEKVAIISSLIFAVTPGSIQYAHFNTTESLLIFIMTTLLYLSSKFYRQNFRYYSVLLGILLGLAYATKIVGLTFGLFPLIAYVLLFLENKKDRLKITISFAIFLFTALLVGVAMAPYQLIDWSNFSKEQSYMQAVTYGKFKPPFVIIYEGTKPYIYPLLNILPFTFGFVSLCCSLLGILLLKKHLKKHLLLFVVIFPLCYFLWAGAWYAKFSRYYLLLVPFLCMYAALFISRLRLYISSVLLFLIVLQGLLFFRVYLEPNTRIAATNWIYQNLPSHSTIATEHWDDGLPLQLSIPQLNKSFINEQLTVYDEDTLPKIKKLSESLAKSDYVILSSRRVYISILNNPITYPRTTKFYKELFAGKLGFSQIKEFTNYPYGISDNAADESFQSYDHPPVVIFKNMNRKNAQQLQDQLL